MTVILYSLGREEAGGGRVTRTYNELRRCVTGPTGRVSDGSALADNLDIGEYCLRFNVGDYYQDLNTKCFYPWCEVFFTVSEMSEKYHVPLIVNPWGYSTYRGS